MPKLPVISGRQCIGALQRAGFSLDRQDGSHFTLVRDRDHVTVPCHGGRDLKPGTLRNIIRQAGLTVEEFTALLK